jgi:hypothetical protein
MFVMIFIETFEARGHKNIRATNTKTLEITKETWLTERGDCIVATGATKGLIDLSEEFKQAAKNKNAKMWIEIKADNHVDVIEGRGSPLLTYRSPISMVVRKSDFVCDRTLMIHSNKAACDLSRNLVDQIQRPEQRIEIKLILEL